MHQNFASLADRHLTFVGLFRHKAAQHILKIQTHFLHTSGNRKAILLLHLNFHQVILHLAQGQHTAHLFASGLVILHKLPFFLGGFVVATAAKQHFHWVFRLLLPLGGSQQLNQPLLSRGLALGAHLLQLLRLNHPHGGFRQITDNPLNIAANIAHFGVLGGLHLDERRAHQTSQPPGDFCFAHAGGANHNDVFWHNLILNSFPQAFAAIAIAQSHSHTFFGVQLADNIFVQFSHNLSWR